MKNQKYIIIIVISLLIVFYLSAIIRLNREVHRKVDYTIEATSDRIHLVLNDVESAVNLFAAKLGTCEADPDSYYSLVEQLVSLNPNLIGSSIAFEPYFFREKGEYFAPSVFKRDGKLIQNQLGNDDYVYYLWDWYQVPKIMDQPYWSEPYYGRGGVKEIITTYSQPIYIHKNGVKQFVGVITADLSLKWLGALVANIKMLETGYALTTSRTGRFITHYLREELVMNETVFSLAEELNDPEMRTIGRDMIAGERGEVKHKLRGQNVWINYININAGWNLIIIFPVSEIYSPLKTITAVLFLILSLISLALWFIIRSARKRGRPIFNDN
jgi:sigma-B regulation protein RsbU (phosphoserine phosphatase)